MDQCKCCRKVHTNITLISPWKFGDEDDDDADEFLKAVLDGSSTDLEKDASLSWFDDLTEKQLSTRSSSTPLQKKYQPIALASGDSLGHQIWSPCPRGGRYSDSDARRDSSLTPVIEPLLLKGPDGDTPSIVGLDSSPSLEHLAGDQSDVKWTSAMATPPCGYSTSFNSGSRGGLNNTSLSAGDGTLIKGKATHRKLFSPSVSNLPRKRDDSLLHLSDLDITKETDITILQEDEGEVDGKMAGIVLDDKDSIDADQTLLATVEKVGLKASNCDGKEPVNENDIQHSKKQHIEAVLNSLFSSPNGSIEMSPDEEFKDGGKMENDAVGCERTLSGGGGKSDSSKMDLSLTEMVDIRRAEDINDCDNHADRPCDQESDYVSDSVCLTALLDGEKVSDSVCLTALLDGEKVLDHVKHGDLSAVTEDRESLVSEEDEAVESLHWDENNGSDILDSCSKQHRKENELAALSSTPNAKGKFRFLMKSKSEKKVMQIHCRFGSTVKSNLVSILKSPDILKSDYRRKVRFSLPKCGINALTPSSDTALMSIATSKDNIDVDFALVGDEIEGLSSKDTTHHNVQDRFTLASEADSHTIQSETPSASTSTATPPDGAHLLKNITDHSAEIVRRDNNDVSTFSDGSSSPPNDRPLLCKKVQDCATDSNPRAREGGCPMATTTAFTKGTVSLSMQSGNNMRDIEYNTDVERHNVCLKDGGSSGCCINESTLSRKKLDLLLDDDNDGDACIKDVTMQFDSHVEGESEKEGVVVNSDISQGLELLVTEGCETLTDCGDFGIDQNGTNHNYTEEGMNGYRSTMHSESPNVLEGNEYLSTERENNTSNCMTLVSKTPLCDSKMHVPVSEHIPDVPTDSSDSLLMAAYDDADITAVDCCTTSVKLRNALIDDVSHSGADSKQTKVEKLSPKNGGKMSIIPLLNTTSSPLKLPSCMASVISVPITTNSLDTNNLSACVINNLVSSLVKKNTDELTKPLNTEIALPKSSLYPLLSTLSSADVLTTSSDMTTNYTTTKTTTVLSPSNLALLSTGTTPTSSFIAKPRKFLYPKLNKMPVTSPETVLVVNQDTSNKNIQDLKTTSGAATTMPSLSTASTTKASTATLLSTSFHKREHTKTTQSNLLQNANDNRFNFFQSEGVKRHLDDNRVSSEATVIEQTGSLIHGEMRGMELDKSTGSSSHLLNKNQGRQKTLPKLLGFARFTDVFGSNDDSETENCVRDDDLCMGAEINLTNPSTSRRHSVDSSVVMTDMNMRKADKMVGTSLTGVSYPEKQKNGNNKAAHGKVCSDNVDDFNSREHTSENESKENPCVVDVKEDEMGGLDDIPSQLWDLTEFSPMKTEAMEKKKLKNRDETQKDTVLQSGTGKSHVKKSFDNGVYINADSDQKRNQSDGDCDDNNKDLYSISHQSSVTSVGLKRNCNAFEETILTKRQKLEKPTRTLSTKLKIFDELFFGDETGSVGTEDTSRETQAGVEDEFENVLRGIKRKSISVSNRMKIKHEKEECNVMNSVTEISENNREANKDTEDKFENVLAGLKGIVASSDESKCKEPEGFQRYGGNGCLLNEDTEYGRNVEENNDQLCPNADEDNVEKYESSIEDVFETKSLPIPRDLNNSTSLESFLVDVRPEPFSENLISEDKRIQRQDSVILQGFQTATGKKIELSHAAKKKADKLWDSVLSESCDSGFKYEQISQKTFKNTNNKGGLSLKSFCTANGKEIEFSDTAEDKASHLWDSVCSENAISDSLSENFSLGSEKMERGEQREGKPFKFGFHTAVGTEIRLSEAARRKADALWESVASKELNGSMLAKGGNSNKRKLECVTPKSDQPLDKRYKGFRPFKSPKVISEKGGNPGSGENYPLKLSDKFSFTRSLKRSGDESCMENNENTVFNNTSGFSTAAESKLKVSVGMEDVEKEEDILMGDDDDTVCGQPKNRRSVHGEEDNADERNFDGQYLNRTAFVEKNGSDECHFDDEFDSQLLAELDLKPSAEVEHKVKKISVNASCDSSEIKRANDKTDGLGLCQTRSEASVGEEGIFLELEGGCCDLKGNSSESNACVYSDGENGILMNKPYTGFSTAAGSVLSVSEKALKTARKFLSEQDVSAVEGNLDSCEYPENKHNAAASKTIVTEIALEKTEGFLNCSDEEMMTLAESKEMAYLNVPSAIKNVEGESYSCSGRANDPSFQFPTSESALEKDKSSMYSNDNESNSANSDTSSPIVTKTNMICGFSTAAGSTVSVPEQALQKAKSFLNDDDIHCGKLIETCASDKIERMENTNCKNFNVFSTAADSEVLVSTKASINTKQFFNDDNGGPLKPKEGKQIDLKKYQKNSFGFPTPTRDSVSISGKVLVSEMSFLNDGNVTAISGKLDQEDADCLLNKHSFIGFSTAAGSQVSVSNEGLSKAKLFLHHAHDAARSGDTKMDTRSRENATTSNKKQNKKSAGFSTAAGTEVSVSGKALAKAKSFLADCDDDHNDGSMKIGHSMGFSTAAGTEVSVSGKALAKAKSFLADCDDDHNDGSMKIDHSIGFSTAAGTEVSVSGKALAKAKSFLADCDDDHNDGSMKIGHSMGFSTAAGTEVSVSGKALAKAKSFLADCDDDHNDGSMKIGHSIGFSTAAGTEVSVSGKALAKAKSFLADCDDDHNDGSMKIGHSIGFSTAAGIEVSVSGKALAKAKSFLADCDDDHNDGSMKIDHSMGFSTAAGTEVSVSGKALAKAKSFLADCDDDHNDGSMKIGHSMGFSNAAGTEVSVSGKALAKAKSFLADCDDDHNDGSMKIGHSIGFSTAAGTEVSVSGKALAKAKSFLADCDDDHNDGSMKIGHSIGFSTAAGTEVSVSGKALAKAKSFLADCDDQNSPLKNNNDSKNSTNFSAVKVPVPKNALRNYDNGNDDGYDSNVGCHRLSGFSSASGLDMSVSKTSLDHAKVFLKDVDEENSNMTNISKDGTKQSSVNDRKYCGNYKNPSFIINSASGSNNICIPRKALEQAEMLFHGKENKAWKATRSNDEMSTAVEQFPEDCVIPGVHTQQMDHCVTARRGVSGSRRCNSNSKTIKRPFVSKSEEFLNDRLGIKRKTLRAVHSNASTGEQNHVPLSSDRLQPKATSVSTLPKTKPTPSAQPSSFIPPASISTTSKFQSSKQQSDDDNISNTSSSNALQQSCKANSRAIAYGKCPVFLPKSNTALAGDRVLRSSRLVKSNNKLLETTNSLPCAPTPLTNRVSVNVLPSDDVNCVTTSDLPGVEGSNVMLGGVKRSSVVNLGNSVKKGRLVSNVNTTQDELLLDDEEVNKFLCENVSTQIGCESVNTDVVNKDDKLIDGRSAGGSDRDCSGIKNYSRKSRSVVCNGIEHLNDSNKCNVIENTKDTEGKGCDRNVCGSGGDISSEMDTSALTESRMRQEKLIRDKKRRRIVPRLGRLMEQRETTATVNRDGERYDLQSLEEWSIGRTLTSQELLHQGVSQTTLRVTSGNAADFKFNFRWFYPGVVPSCVLVGDGATLVPDGKGLAGSHEFYKAFLTLDGVDPNLVDESWVRNHFRWIVWKLAAYEVCFPQAFAGRSLTPHNVMLQLKYRCDREVDKAQRGALKKILEKDDASTKRLVLCVAGIKKDDAGQTLVEMTDGWYSIWSTLDTPLSSLLSSSRLNVGVKVITSGAELEGAGQGCSPLEMGDGVRLSLRANSTRPACGSSRLGFQSNPMALCVPVSSLHPDGGMVGCVDVVVARIYPVMYMEKQGEGKYVFRTQEEEDGERKRQSERREREMERIYHSLQAKMEKEEEEKRKTKVKRRPWNRKEVADLCTGEELLEAWESAFNQEDFQMLLSQDQLQKLLDHRQASMLENQMRMSDRVRQSMGGNSTLRERSVMPVQKLRVAGCCNKDIDLQSESMLTVWRPSSDWSDIREGQRYRMFHLAVSSSRWNGSGSGGRQYLNNSSGSKVALASTRQTRMQKLHIGENLLDLVYTPREVLTVNEIDSLSGGTGSSIEFDFVGVALKVEPPGGDGARPLLITSVDKQGDVLVIKMWKGAKSVASSVKEKQCFVALNLSKCHPKGSNSRRSGRRQRGRLTFVAAEARQEMASFSTSVGGCKHGQTLMELKEQLAKTPAFLEKARLHFEKENTLSFGDGDKGCQRPTVPDVLEGQRELFTEDYDDDFPPEIVDKIFNQLTPNGSVCPSPNPQHQALPHCAWNSTNLLPTHSLKLKHDHKDKTVGSDSPLSVSVTDTYTDDINCHGCVTQRSNSEERKKCSVDFEVETNFDLRNKKIQGEEEGRENIQENEQGGNMHSNDNAFGRIDNDEDANNDEEKKGVDNEVKPNSNSKQRSRDVSCSGRKRIGCHDTSKGKLDRQASSGEEFSTGIPRDNLASGETCSHSEAEEKGDLVLRRRKNNLRDKMTKLLRYGRAQSLTPLPGKIMSPACVKQFKSPHSSSNRR